MSSTANGQLRSQHEYKQQKSYKHSPPKTNKNISATAFYTEIRVIKNICTSKICICCTNI